MDANDLVFWGFYIQIALMIIQILSLGALVVYVIKTWEMASSTRAAAQAAEKTVQEMKEARELDQAPYVVAYFEVPNDTRVLELVIKNVGKGVATNVKVFFDPPLQSDFPEQFARILPPDGIPFIPANGEIRTSIGSFLEYKTSGRPMAFTVTTTYSGITSQERTITYQQDLMIFRGMVYTHTKEPKLEDFLKEIQKLKAVQEALAESVQEIALRLSSGRHPEESL